MFHVKHTFALLGGAWEDGLRLRLEVERVAHVRGQAEVGLAVARGGGAVHDDQVVALEEVDEARGWVHGCLLYTSRCV